MMFKEIIAVHTEKNTKPKSTFCGQSEELLIVKAGDTCSEHMDFKELISDYSYRNQSWGY
jgi:hypothetical protein